MQIIILIIFAYSAHCYLSLDINRREDANNVAVAIERQKILANAHLNKRSVDLALYQANTHLLYYANISIGTPGQRVSLAIDTGSSDLWVADPNTSFCKNNPVRCADTGTYSSNLSSTFTDVNTNFQISYVDGTYGHGHYGTENFLISDQTVTGLQFGYGTDATSENGVLGVGMILNEASVYAVYSDGSPVGGYNNLPLKLKAEGVTQRNVYSLYLNSYDSPTGNILFGAVDSAKYNGPLQLVDINLMQGFHIGFSITLTNVAITSPGTSEVAVSTSALPLEVILDSGASYTALPDDTLASIGDALGATYNSQVGLYIFPTCRLRSVQGFVSFFFGTIEIKVPFSEFVVQPTDINGNIIRFSSGEILCAIGATGTYGGMAILGDSFLRSAYVVYDLDRYQVAMAQAVYTGSSNVVEVTGDIPGGVHAGSSATLSVSSTATLSSQSTGSQQDQIFGTGASTTNNAMRNTEQSGKVFIYTSFIICLNAWLLFLF